MRVLTKPVIRIVVIDPDSPVIRISSVECWSGRMEFESNGMSAFFLEKRDMCESVDTPLDHLRAIGRNSFMVNDLTCAGIWSETILSCICSRCLRDLVMQGT
jgi:hypothetical protein